VTKMTVTPSILYSRKPHMIHANLTAVCFIEPELWPIEVLYCGNTHFNLFAPVTLTLTLT